MKSVSFVASVALAVVTTPGSLGCSGSGTHTPSRNDYDHVAQATAALLIQASGGGEVGSMYDSASLAVGITPLGVTANGAASFGDAHAGLDYTLTVSCSDAAGAALPACGPKTNVAQANVAWSGNLTLLPDFTATVTRRGSWTLSGVGTGAATFGGTSSFDLTAQFTSVFDGARANVDLVYSASYDAVTYSTLAHHATGGSIDYSIVASGAASGPTVRGGATFATDAHVVFNPDGSATLTLDGMYRYQVLAGGVVVKI
jgi:hypothetical protein